MYMYPNSPIRGQAVSPRAGVYNLVVDRALWRSATNAYTFLARLLSGLLTPSRAMGQVFSVLVQGARPPPRSLVDSRVGLTVDEFEKVLTSFLGL